MILGLLIACADSPDATLDEDNWLSGSFVSEYEPTIESVTVDLAQAEVGVDTTVTYDGALTLTAPAPPPVGSTSFDVGPSISSPFVEVENVDALSLQWTWTDDAHTEVTGSFSATFTTVNGDVFDVSGAFRGPATL